MAEFISKEIDNSPIVVTEQNCVHKKEEILYIRNLNLELKGTDYEGRPVYLGLSQDLYASYYIGLDWLKRGSRALAVLPKMNVDINKMFVTALNFAPSADYFNNFYGIKINEPYINFPQANALLTPLLIVHYLYVMQKLLKQGLVHGYVNREENLKSKIKGHIAMTRHISHNVILHREDRIMCHFQDYTVDIPINRLLKRALIFSLRALSITKAEELNKVQIGLRKCLLHFSNVSDKYVPGDLKGNYQNKLYRYYRIALPIAKMILKRYDNSIDNVSDNYASPPFWIDMSRLYEVYVYSKLYEKLGNKQEIKFQVSGGHGTASDFVVPIQNLVIDAKYKPRYNYGNSKIIDDIREISGYARDEKITFWIKESEDWQEPKCLIIYPFIDDNEDKQEKSSINTLQQADGNDLCKNATTIRYFRRFYKLAVELPQKE